MQAGWLSDFTDWLIEQIEAVWDAVVEFCHDMLIFAVEAVVEFALALVNMIPVPDFIQGMSMGAMLSGLPPGVLWFMGVLRFSECMAILGAGVAFRLIRKAITLGQW